MDSNLDESHFEPDYDEVGIEDPTTMPSDNKPYSGNTEGMGSSGFVGELKIKKKSGWKRCPLCEKCVKTHLKRHVLYQHLPWYLAPMTACWQCKKQESTPCFSIAHHSEHSKYFDDDNLKLWCRLVNGLLHFIRFRFGVDTLDDLLHCVVDRELFPKPDGSFQLFSDIEFRLLKVYDVVCGNPVVEYSMDPPNAVICLIQWRIMCNMLLFLDSNDREYFKTLECQLSVEGFPEVDLDPSSLSRLPFIDSHFHLDRILACTRLSNFHELECKVGHSSRLEFQFGIANYVFPKLWSRWEEQVGGDSRIGVTFGVHPHLVRDADIKKNISDLKFLLSLPSCVGLGEVGLDLTTVCKECKPACGSPENCQRLKVLGQERFLQEVLPLAVIHDKTIVLHCRDKGSGEASARVLQLIKDSGLTNQNIHYHCFSEGEEVMKQWVDACPNVSFGFTATLLRNPETQKALRKLDVRKIVIESDSPYLPVGHCGLNLPWHMSAVVDQIALLKNMPQTFLLDCVNANVQRLYCF